MIKTYKNDFLNFTIEEGNTYTIGDDFAIAKYKIKQLGKNFIRAEVVDDKVFKVIGGVINIQVGFIDYIEAV